MLSEKIQLFSLKDQPDLHNFIYPDSSVSPSLYEDKLGWFYWRLNLVGYLPIREILGFQMTWKLERGLISNNWGENQMVMVHLPLLKYLWKNKFWYISRLRPCLHSPLLKYFWKNKFWYIPRLRPCLQLLWRIFGKNFNA